MAGSEDDESKTEEPSDRKIAQAREKGNEPVSHEVHLFVSLIGMTVVVFLAGGEMLVRLLIVISGILGGSDKLRIETSHDAMALLRFTAMELALLVTPAVLLMATAGIAAAVLQNPVAIRSSRIMPDFSRISPASGFSRIFGSKGLASFARTVAKLILIACVAYLIFKRSIGSMLLMQMEDPHLLPGQIHALITSMLMSVAIAAVSVALADFGWSRLTWHKSLRMTPQEVKDEHKQADGDPAIKARVKAIARERSRRRMMAAVPQATLVVVNPTHYAVALRYQRAEGGAPLVVARGVDEIALKIRVLAERHDIPVIEDVGLARMLYEKTRLDQSIPAEFFVAIAKLLTILYATKSPSPKSIRKLPHAVS